MRHAANHRRVAGYLDADLFQKQLGESPHGDAGGGLARARTFKYVSEIVSVVLEAACKVCVARPGPRQAARALIVREFARLDVHHVLPVFKIAVANNERDGRAERIAVAHA